MACTARLDLVGWATSDGAAHVLSYGYWGSYPHTLLYLSIRGVQGVIMINVMLMADLALKKFLKLSCTALPRVHVALPRSGC